jgi:hypothetical protein
MAVCAMASMSPSSEAYLRHTMALSLLFAVPNKHAEIASGRAQSFVGRFGTMKLQVATAYLIQTYNPEGAGDNAYYRTRTPGRSVAVFDVECQTGGTFEGDEADSMLISSPIM